MRRILVTGCGGFVGSVLVRSLVDAGADVHGADLGAAPSSFPGARYTRTDLADFEAVMALIDKTAPDGIIHLAAHSSAGRSFKDPHETIRNNVHAALNLLESLRRSESTARLLAVGSADEYGPVDPVHLPLVETRQAHPANPYALSKAVQTQCCSLYHSLYGIDVVMTRSFNHTGAGQTDTFVLPSFAKQIVEIKHKLRDPVMEVGNLDIKRDFLDVRDVVEAYLLLLRKGRAGEIYNVCSGTSCSLKELLHKLCALAKVTVEIRVREDRIRPTDTPELRGNKLKITRDTGWSPAISIDETLQSLIDYWHGVIVGSGGRERK